MPYLSVPGSVLPSGGTLDVAWRFRVPHDLPALHVSATAEGAHFFKVGNAGIPYASTLDIPIWDVGTVTASTVASTTDAGVPTAITQVTLINNGRTATPGPVEVQVAVKYTETGSGVAWWTGRTPGPIEAGSTVTVIGQGEIARGLEPDFMVDSGLVTLCPDGSYGQLSDGNRADDSRTLRRQ